MNYLSIQFLLVLVAASLAGAQTPPRLARLNTSESIADYLEAHEFDSSLAARKKLYEERFGKVGYNGTRAQNVRLLESFLLENAEAALSAYCAIDTTTVALCGASTRAAFEALPSTSLRIASLNRNPTRAVGQPSFYVVLSARETKLPETLGHAWVAFGIRGFEKGDPDQCLGSAFGNYPIADKKKGIVSSFKTVPGSVVQGWLANLDGSEQVERVRFVVEVDEQAYRAARDVVTATRTRMEYQLLAKDCVTMVREVAKAIGLKVGDRIRDPMPAQAVEALIRDNLPTK